MLDKESELGREKAEKEEQALRLLNDDLQTQLQSIENQAASGKGGLVTPQKMDSLLRVQYKQTVDGYEQFVNDSAQEL